jgi:hypothetical protein
MYPVLQAPAPWKGREREREKVEKTKEKKNKNGSLVCCCSGCLMKEEQVWTAAAKLAVGRRMLRVHQPAHDQGLFSGTATQRRCIQYGDGDALPG